MANAGNPTGNAPCYGNAPNIPTAAQLAQLATLQAAAATAVANYHTARAGAGSVAGSFRTLHAAMLNAQFTVVTYQTYIYGGQKDGIYDEGGPTVT